MNFCPLKMKSRCASLAMLNETFSVTFKHCDLKAFFNFNFVERELRKGDPLIYVNLSLLHLESLMCEMHPLSFSLKKVYPWLLSRIVMCIIFKLFKNCFFFLLKEKEEDLDKKWDVTKWIEKHRKSLIHYCERSELRFYFEWTKVH